MGLKEEIEELRGKLEQQIDAAGLKKSAADKLDRGARAFEEGAQTARRAAETLRDPKTRADAREGLDAAMTEAGALIEEFPAKYPMVTALAALGVGVALGLSLGRRLR